MEQQTTVHDLMREFDLNETQIKQFLLENQLSCEASLNNEWSTITQCSRFVHLLQSISFAEASNQRKQHELFVLALSHGLYNLASYLFFAKRIPLHQTVIQQYLKFNDDSDKQDAKPYKKIAHAFELFKSCARFLGETSNPYWVIGDDALTKLKQHQDFASLTEEIIPARRLNKIQVGIDCILHQQRGLHLAPQPAATKHYEIPDFDFSGIDVAPRPKQSAPAKPTVTGHGVIAGKWIKAILKLDIKLSDQLNKFLSPSKRANALMDQRVLYRLLVQPIHDIDALSQMLERLLRWGAKFTKATNHKLLICQAQDRQEPLFKIALAANLSCLVRALIEAGIDPFEVCHGKSFLEIALRQSDKNILDIILTQGPSEQQRKIRKRIKSDPTFLHAAIEGGDSNVVQKCLELDANPLQQDSLGLTAFDKIANWDHNGALVKNLLEAAYRKIQQCPASDQREIWTQRLINQQYSDGCMLLHRCIYHGHLEGVIILVALGADLTLPYNNGCNGLHLIAKYQRYEMLQAIQRLYTKLQPGWGRQRFVAALNQVSKAGSTPLHTALQGGQFAIFDQFLKAGADPFISAGVKSPIMHYICGKNKIKYLLLLKQYTTPKQFRQLLTLPNNRGETPLQIAKQKRHTNLLQVINQICSVERSPTPAALRP